MGCDSEHNVSNHIFLPNDNFDWKLIYTIIWLLTIFFFALQAISILFFSNPYTPSGPQEIEIISQKLSNDPEYNIDFQRVERVNRTQTD